MATKLTVKKEYLDAEIHTGYNNSSFKVTLKTATQEELAILKGLGHFDYLFEKIEKQ